MWQTLSLCTLDCTFTNMVVWWMMNTFYKKQNKKKPQSSSIYSSQIFRKQTGAVFRLQRYQVQAITGRKQGVRKAIVCHCSLAGNKSLKEARREWLVTLSCQVRHSHPYLMSDKQTSFKKWAQINLNLVNLYWQISLSLTAAVEAACWCFVAVSKRKES